MDLRQFLHQNLHEQMGSKRGATCFYGKEYPFFFFKLFFSVLESYSGLTNKPCYLFKQTDCSLEQLKQIVCQQVLGESFTYWLGDIDQIFKANKIGAVIDFLISYTGPHHIIFFTATALPLPDSLAHVFLPSDVSIDEATQILEVLGNKQVAKKALKSISSCVSQDVKVSLGIICQFYYAALLLNQQNCWHYCMAMAELENNAKLSLLTDYFFSKKTKEFFYAWKSLEASYTTIFWTTFWTDVLWRAYTVVICLERKNFSGAKQVAYRLPTAFLSTYSKQFSASYLASLHKISYAVDCAMKQGSELFIDILFAVHFFTDNHLKR